MFVSLEEPYVEYLLKDGAQDTYSAVGVTAILRALVVSVPITPAEALAEVVAILLSINVVAVIAVGRILIGIGVLIAGIAPAVLAVGLPGAKALLVTVVNGLTKKLSPVLVRLVVSAATRVAIVIRRVVVLVVVALVL